jgi:hypothetical protein
VLKCRTGHALGLDWLDGLVILQRSPEPRRPRRWR